MRKTHIIIILLIILLVLYLFYYKLAFLDVIVKFDNLEPFEKQMNVYFKGFKIGKTVKIYPDKEFQNTYLKLRIVRAKIRLPENVTAKISKKKSGGYVSIIYPDEPSLKKLKNNDEIKGVLTKDINSLLEEKFSENDIDEILGDATNIMESANTAIQNLSDIFVEVRDIIQDSKSDIAAARKNLTKTTENLYEMSESLNKTISGQQMQNSVDNIEQTTENIKLITENLDNITNEIENTTLPIVNSVLCETKFTVKNVKEITGGVKNTLKKRMGLSRVLFGRPMSEDK